MSLPITCALLPRPPLCCRVPSGLRWEIHDMCTSLHPLWHDSARGAQMQRTVSVVFSMCFRRCGTQKALYYLIDLRLYTLYYILIFCKESCFFPVVPEGIPCADGRSTSCYTSWVTSDSSKLPLEVLLSTHPHGRCLGTCPRSCGPELQSVLRRDLRFSFFFWEAFFQNLHEFITFLKTFFI